MRTKRHSQKVVASLLAATVAGFMSLAIMPEIRCSTNRCVPAMGKKCVGGGQILHDYKMVVGFDG